MGSFFYVYETLITIRKACSKGITHLQAFDYFMFNHRGFGCFVNFFSKNKEDRSKQRQMTIVLLQKS